MQQPAILVSRDTLCLRYSLLYNSDFLLSYYANKIYADVYMLNYLILNVSGLIVRNIVSIK